MSSEKRRATPSPHVRATSARFGIGAPMHTAQKEKCIKGALMLRQSHASGGLVFAWM